MTQEELNAIRNRCEGATPGPWFHIDSGNVSYISKDPSWTPENKDISNEIGIIKFERDANLINCARTDIPALLDHIKAQEEEIERLKFQNKMFQQRIDDLKNGPEF